MDAAVLTRGAAYRGSSAAALSPTGKPSDVPSPIRMAPATATGRTRPKTIMRSPATAVAVDEPGAEPAPRGHRGQEEGEGQGAQDGRSVVPVDHPEAQPVVPGPF